MKFLAKQVLKFQVLTCGCLLYIVKLPENIEYIMK